MVELNQYRPIVMYDVDSQLIKNRKIDENCVWSLVDDRCFSGGENISVWDRRPALTMRTNEKFCWLPSVFFQR